MKRGKPGLNVSSPPGDARMFGRLLVDAFDDPEWGGICKKQAAELGLNEEDWIVHQMKKGHVEPIPEEGTDRDWDYGVRVWSAADPDRFAWYLRLRTRAAAELEKEMAEQIGSPTD